MRLKIVTYVFLLILVSCGSKLDERQIQINNEDEIIDTYLRKGAWNYNFLSKESEDWINKGLRADSTVAYLWQQKANPYWKQKKYSLAVSFYNKAVELDRQEWLSRLGFLKCIFAKDYDSALIDLLAYKKEFGSTVEQDHSIELYIGLCYLQLSQYPNALNSLLANVEKEGTGWVHYLDRFYLAVVYYELEDYESAIFEFDKVLKEYPRFSDAQYYKSICLNYLGRGEEARRLMEQGQLNFENEHTFNEDSSRYEDYPYQVSWQWQSRESMLK